MLNRRDLCAGLGTSLGISATGLTGAAHAQNATLPFYGSLGPKLIRYSLDVAQASLREEDSVTLPANLQYAWPHPNRRFLYVVASNGQPPSGPTGAAGSDPRHYAIAYRVGAGGKLTEHGPRRLLPVRPINCCTTIDGNYLLVAFNIPPMVHVFPIKADGTLGTKIAQDPALDFGIYAHQVRATPSGKTVTVCSRGNDARRGRPEDPGHIEVFGFKDGQLSKLQQLAPHGNGIGFGPRHLDFSKDGRFVYISMERESALCVYGMDRDGRMSDEPLFFKNALSNGLSGEAAKKAHPGQGVGPIHVSPDGRFVYQTNRGSGTMEKNGRRVWNGGENSVAVWAIDPRSGEPTLIQNAPAHGFELRTFVIDPSNKLLVTASTTAEPVEGPDGGIQTVSAGLSLYRIAADGRLSFVRKHDVDTSHGIQFWCGLLTMG